ncbi:ATPase AAA [Streptomyces ruber]|uniref:ATPase AAA n=2 Tax=Streptomyces TaxID=1883 RepID=A0A918ENU6_9ACTN|nr:ATP-binding protein [Streptomyces ruber]GGQ42633.1 ATPase AAA [Streptomyces ruber]
MDPTSPGSDEYGHEDGRAPRPRPPREALTPDFGQHAPALARTVQVVTGDFLLTVNPVDGSEVENCPPAERPGRPGKHPAAERTELDRAARPPAPSGPARPRMPLLQRHEERERLVRLLARGRSVHLTGPAGSGRTALLDLVAEDCAGLAPDGVVRLTGHRRTPADLLYDLFAAVHAAPLHRPGPDELLAYVREIGAVVVLDDVEFGGGALDELLDATPECAFLIAATPDVPGPSAGSSLEEVVLGGLGRDAGLHLLERAVGRVLTEDETTWAGDLWFESEGLPLRFVQAGALLRQRDRLRADSDAVDDLGVFAEAPDSRTPASSEPGDVPRDTGDGYAPLPSLAEAAAPAALLASRLSESARETLRIAVALGGEVPHQAHLPALVGDTHADAALAELVSTALVTPVGARYRLAAGVLAQLEAAGYADDAEERAVSVAQHYSWWAGHPSVTPERVTAEADAVLAALTVLVPLATPPGEGEESAAVRLARQAAPAFAAGLDWGAWERALRSGAEASRLAGEVGEQAYFHHELGVLALLSGQLDRARAELETSIGLRGALADKRGTVAGRRALALVADRSGATPPGGRTAAGEEVPDARHEESASPPGGVPAAPAAASYPTPQPHDRSPAVVAQRTAASKGGIGGRLVSGARRNLVAAGAGALLAAVLGTVVTLGATSDGGGNAPSEQVGVDPSASPGFEDDSLGADRAKQGPNDDPGTVTTPTDPGPDGTPGTADDPSPTGSAEPSDDPSGSRKPDDDEPSGSGSPSGATPSKSPSTPTKPGTPPGDTSEPDPDPEPTGSTSDPVTPPESTTPPEETEQPEDPPPPETSTSASGTAPGAPTTESGPAGTPGSTGTGSAGDPVNT